VASRIAAGEVVERPASLLKELLENSVDAGATKITVESEGAGRARLRVVDDGHGMSRVDCELSLQRHATSKISSMEDLQKLGTFGFRGEALYAISAVSKLTLQSRGWKLEAEGGKVKRSGPAPAVPGTMIETRDLFYNTPARLKFLKSDTFERGKLAAVIEEVALANPSLRIEYKSEGRTNLRFEATDERKRVKDVIGEDLADGLLEVTAERAGIKLRMFISPSGKLAASRSFQWWFVNKRPIASNTLRSALYKAYEGSRSPAQHPVCVAFLELSPDSFDVNVHPGKREVRFHNERTLFELVSGLAGSALLKAKVAQPITVSEPPPSFYLGGRGFIPQVTAPTQTQFFPAETQVQRWYEPPYRYLGQIERAYLVFESNGGLFVLDQHAAAERILFERYLAELVDGGSARSQKLMLPLPLELPASAIQTVLSRKARLKKLGFSLEPFGKTTLHVTAVPALFHKADDLKQMAHRVIDNLDPRAAAEDVTHEAVATIACKAAVKAHDGLSEREALKLLEDLKDCKDGTCCPHGRRSMLALNREELARRFQRPGAPPL
jgi:DNA mismatch repair protein MutL